MFMTVEVWSCTWTLPWTSLTHNRSARDAPNPKICRWNVNWWILECRQEADFFFTLLKEVDFEDSVPDCFPSEVRSCTKAQNNASITCLHLFFSSEEGDGRLWDLSEESGYLVWTDERQHPCETVSVFQDCPTRQSSTLPVGVKIRLCFGSLQDSLFGSKINVSLSFIQSCLRHLCFCSSVSKIIKLDIIYICEEKWSSCTVSA